MGIDGTVWVNRDLIKKLLSTQNGWNNLLHKQQFNHPKVSNEVTETYCLDSVSSPSRRSCSKKAPLRGTYAGFWRSSSSSSRFESAALSGCSCTIQQHYLSRIMCSRKLDFGLQTVSWRTLKDRFLHVIVHSYINECKQEDSFINCTLSVQGWSAPAVALIVCYCYYYYYSVTS